MTLLKEFKQKSREKNETNPLNIVLHLRHKIYNALKQFFILLNKQQLFMYSLKFQL